MTRILKVLNFVISISLSFLFSYILVRFNPEINDLEIVKDEYVLNLIGILMGLSIAVITFLFTTIEKIRANLLENKLYNGTIRDIEVNIRNLYKSIMKDTIAIFISFILLLVCILTKGIDFPILKVPIFVVFSKEELVLITKLSLLFITLSALFDIIVSLFGIITGFNKSSELER
ncbi:hypothetical protein [Ornithinibacillus californiensis]|uniref:hypothetical protein n=1 Tax=Ornithinibacillus californiensis TaxID=161536 RepID=UPI00064DA4E2|nr:hypothetical protein [Ornithinibacillus californiensis]